MTTLPPGDPLGYGCPAIMPGPPPAHGVYKCELGQHAPFGHCFAGITWNDAGQATGRADADDPEDGPVKTEYAQRMSGGGWTTRWDDPKAEETWPVANWIAAMREQGGKVYRRRVIVVEDWTEVKAP